MNSIRNVPVKYKYIKENNIIESMTHEEKKYELRDALIEVIVNNKKLFIIAE